MITPQQEQQRWQALCERQAQADFVYGVMTTGVFCRPGCPARRPRRSNVRFFDAPMQALQAGYRPCLRCHPLCHGHGESPEAQTVVRLCRYIEQSPTPPSLVELAAQCHWSRHHLQRRFKAIVGISPFHYAQAVRQRRLTVALQQTPNITHAMLEAGFGSATQFYDQSTTLLGMAPASAQARGRGELIRVALGQCSLGALLVASSKRGLCAILLGDEPQALLDQLQDQFANAKLTPADEHFANTFAQVAGLIDQPGQTHCLPLDIRGTAFQQQVWMALQQIPRGETLSYQQLAERIGKPAAVRAVARACAANRLAVAIPCHRIVRSDGRLSGYRWGVERKRTLLLKEGAVIDHAD